MLGLSLTTPAWVPAAASSSLHLARHGVVASNGHVANTAGHHLPRGLSPFGKRRARLKENFQLERRAEGHSRSGLAVPLLQAWPGQ